MKLLSGSPQKAFTAKYIHMLRYKRARHAGDEPLMSVLEKCFYQPKRLIKAHRRKP